MKVFACLLTLCVTLAAYAAPIKVACIGDSITFGYGLPEREKNCYPTQLQQLLGDKYEVRNFGNSGRGIYLHSWRGKERRGYRYMKEHQAALAWQPDIVICNLGINDNGEFLKHEQIKPGAFRDDYITLLKDYMALPSQPKLYIWGKLAPLAPGQKFYRSPEPFLMQPELAAVAAATGATLIDMQKPLLPLLMTAFPDQIHPNAEGAKVIAETTHKVLTAEPPKVPESVPLRAKNSVGWAEPANVPGPVALPEDIKDTAETWLCAGQSNMFWPLARCLNATEEANATAKHDIRIWDFVSGQWHKVTPQNARHWSALAVSFAIRRAEASGKPIAILLVGVGGSPTEAFLSEEVMAATNPSGKPLYPNLLKILTNRKPYHENEDFPFCWVKERYARGATGEAAGWAIANLWDNGIERVKHLPLTGILWYQGESNASIAVGSVKPDKALPEDYMEETLRAVVRQLRPDKKTPFLMVGLPMIDRDWAPYRKLQEKVCRETGATYLDTFGAGLGERNNVHPKDKISVAKIACEAAEKALR